MRELLWFACSECFPIPAPKVGCPVCDGTGQYQAFRPTKRDQGPDAHGEDRERSLAWVRTIKEGHK